MNSEERDSGHDGLDPQLLIEQVLGAPREFTSHEIAAAAGVPVHRARKFWRALGLANVVDTAAEFTSIDAEALKLLLRLIADDILSETEALQLTRVLGRTGARVARSYSETMLEALIASSARPTDHIRIANVVDRSLADLQSFLNYSWRRHAAAALNRLTLPAGNHFTTVGFADLVDFTRLSRQLSPSDLTNLVSRFEERSGDVITAHGGRLIKSLGDEVLFVADVPSVAARIALQMVHNVSRRRIPGIRIGLEYGPIISHSGDVFGETVNLASRLTTMAEPNHILIGPQIAEALAGLPDFEVVTVESVEVHGFGLVAPALLRRPEKHRWLDERPTQL